MNELPIQWVDFFICLIVLLVDVDVALLFLKFWVQFDCVVLLLDDFVLLADLVL